jgi:hypothetical protein
LGEKTVAGSGLGALALEINSKGMEMDTGTLEVMAWEQRKGRVE